MSTMTRPSAPRTPAPHATAITTAPSPPHDVRVVRRAAPSREQPADAVPRVDRWDLIVPGGPAGQFGLRAFRPVGLTGPLPVVVCVHGGNSDGADDLAGSLAVDLNCAVLVPDRGSAATTAQIEQVYATIGWIAVAGRNHGLDRTRVALAANHAGADVADAVMLMADRRGGPVPVARVLLSARTTAVLRAALAA
jgi:acetyl esterase/lipase